MRNLLRARMGLAVSVAAATATWLAGEARGQIGAPGGAGSNNPTAMQTAQMAVRLLALRSPNPYVRETAYHDRDEDWSFDLAARTFSVKLRGPAERLCRGKLVPAGGGETTAVFDDEASLSREWVVPTNTVLTADEAQRCLTEMGQRMTGPDLLKTLCGALKGTADSENPATGEVTGSGQVARSNVGFRWSIDLHARTFILRLIQMSTEVSSYSGRFGWDKEHKWTAWPVGEVHHTMAGTQPERPVIPAHIFGRNGSTFASSSLPDHPGAAAMDGSTNTYWQPAADDDKPTLAVDLGRVVKLSRIRLTYPKPGGYQLKIDVSDDQKTWLPLGDRLTSIPEVYTGTSGAGNTLDVSTPANTAGRYVRLAFLPPPAAPIQLSEVVIEGAVLSGAVPARVDPAPELKFDEAALTKATERGAALVKASRWEMPLTANSGPGNGVLYNAGELVIWSCGRNPAIAVVKGTGKQAWLGASGTQILALGPGEKGAEMLVTGLKLSNGRAVQGSNFTGLQEATDRSSRWEISGESPSALLAPKQVLVGARAGAYYGDGALGSVSGYDPSTTLRVRAYDRATGREQWTYTLPPRTFATRPLTYADGVLYVVTAPFTELTSTTPREPSTLIAINSIDGTSLFVLPLQEFLSPVVLTYGEAVASSSSGEVVGFDAKTGKEKWRERLNMSRVPGSALMTRQLDPTQAPVVAGSSILVPVRGLTAAGPAQRTDELDAVPGLAALDAKTHKQVWFFRPPEVRMLSLSAAQVDQARVVMLASGLGSRATYMGVDLKTGRLDWLLPADSDRRPGLNYPTLPLVSDGVMYIVKNSRLMAIPLEPQ
jgi:outer membrane protein assembly factor BamB